MNSYLHIVKPIGFEISDRTVKRAGLDYWDELELTIHESAEDFLRWLGDRKPWLVTSHGRLRYDKPGYKDNEILVFGNETGGLSRKWLDTWPDRSVYVPIIGSVRNYNLSNTVSIVLAHASLKAGVFDRN
jgi:tRNA (cytidine/uridine-2'-O-)-methyltransferase